MKRRGNDDHLSGVEIEILEEGYRSGRTQEDLAAELNMHPKSVYRRFKKLRLAGVSRQPARTRTMVNRVP